MSVIQSFDGLFEAQVCHNIDDVRAEIMWLEGEETFDPAAWERVLHVLREQGRQCGYEDAYRRMQCAMDRAVSFLPDHSIVAAETE